MKLFATTLFFVSIVAMMAGCGTESRSNTAHHTATDHNSGNVAPVHPGSNGAQMNHSAMQSSPDAANAPFDLQFIDTMTAHHQAAVEMAWLAETRAQHSELRETARSIIADQEREIADMKRWRDQWFPGKPPALNLELDGMHDSMKEMDMGKLQSAVGNDFDLQFIAEMIPHHEGAVKMAEEALQRSRKEEIRNLAKAIIKSQSDEIGKMASWQKAWAR